MTSCRLFRAHATIHFHRLWWCCSRGITSIWYTKCLVFKVEQEAEAAETDGTPLASMSRPSSTHHAILTSLTGGVACCQYVDLLPLCCCRQLISTSQEHFGEFNPSLFMKNKWGEATSASWSPSTVHQGTTSETLAPNDPDWRAWMPSGRKGGIQYS